MTSNAETVLEALPYGVVVVDADGRVRHANAAARDLVHGIGTPAVICCHDLFACRESGGPCDSECLVTRAARDADAGPEVRIDAAGGRSPGALWVTAARLPDSDGGGAILHLRAGERGDRRRRSDVRWRTGPELRIYALGRTHVEALDDSVDGRWLRQRAGQVLKYLLCNRERIVLVDEIAESIWPGSGRQTVANTRYVIHQLRARLEPRRSPGDPPTFLVARGGGYTLDLERVWTDVDEFEEAIDDGRAAMARIDAVQARRHLEHAIDLYRGEFLADEPYAHWANDERIRLAGMATYALRVSTALAHERGDVDAAVGHLERLGELEPFDGSVHRELSAVLLRAGRYGDAKRRYDRFAERLLREFGESPDFDLRSLRVTSEER